MAYNSSQQIKLGAVISYLALGLNIITGLIFTPWVIKSIGKEEYGLFTLAMSVISLFVFDFGLSSAVTRFVAKYLAEGKLDKANKCIGLVYKLYIYIDIALVFVLTVVYFYIPYIYKELTPEEIEKFRVVFCVAAVFTIFSFPLIPVNGILNANEKFIELKVCDSLHKILVVILMAISLVCGLGLIALVVTNAVAGLIMNVAKLHCINRYTKMRADFKYNNKQEFYSIIKFSGWTSVIALCSRMIFTIAPTILGMLSGSLSIAIFGIANSIEGYVFYFSNALGGLFLPRISNILAKEGGDVMPLMIKVGRIQIYIVGLVVAGFVCLGNNFIELWIGDGFFESYICTLLLIAPCYIHLPQDIGMQTIVVKNEVKYQAYIWVVMAIINVVLSFILTSKFGAIGISTSIFIAYIIRTIGVDILLQKRLKLDIWLFFKESFFKLTPMIICVMILSTVFNSMLNSESIHGFVIKTTVFIVLFSIGFLIFSTKEEKRLLKICK